MGPGSGSGSGSARVSFCQRTDFSFGKGVSWTPPHPGWDPWHPSTIFQFERYTATGLGGPVPDQDLDPGWQESLKKPAWMQTTHDLFLTSQVETSAVFHDLLLTEPRSTQPHAV